MEYNQRPISMLSKSYHAKNSSHQLPYYQDSRAQSSYFFLRGFMFSVYVTVSLYLMSRVRYCLDNCLDRHVLAESISLCFVGITGK